MCCDISFVWVLCYWMCALASPVLQMRPGLSSPPPAPSTGGGAPGSQTTGNSGGGGGKGKTRARRGQATDPHSIAERVSQSVWGQYLLSPELLALTVTERWGQQLLSPTLLALATAARVPWQYREKGMVLPGGSRVSVTDDLRACDL